MPTFILSDAQQVNSYGFRVRTEGISLARFRANPVMLDSHWNSTSSVLGRWENIRVEGGQLLADSVFDDADPDVAKIKGKVDRGFLKGASIGLTFKRDDMQLQPDGSYLLTRCELLEASIVAVPSNGNAIRLYAPDGGKPLSEDQVKLMLAGEYTNQGTSQGTANPPASNQSPNQSPNTMSKIVLSAVALQALALTTTDDAAQLTAGIENLVAELNATKGKLQAATDKLLAQANAQAKQLVANAIAEGRLTADVQAEFENMAMSNYELAAKVIGAMPAKQSLAAQVTGTQGKAAEVKSIDDFEKLPLDKQLAFKNENPEAYKALFA